MCPKNGTTVQYSEKLEFHWSQTKVDNTQVIISKMKAIKPPATKLCKEKYYVTNEMLQVELSIEKYIKNS